MATKTLINSLFTAIRKGNELEVRRLVEADPTLVHSRRTAPPKKDDGQSPLQVAFKTGRFGIAAYLIDRGADVRYMEQTTVNEWRAPVLHDAIRAAAFNMRISVAGSQETFSEAIALIRRILKLGADPNAVDSFGNSCLLRALADLRIQLTSRGIFDAAATPSHAVFDEDAKALLGTLIEAGADIRASNATRESALDFVRGRYFERFFSAKPR